MIQFSIKNISIWVGKHQTLGIVIYDTNDQSGIDSNAVRLHKLDQDLPCIFQKEVVRRKMVRLEKHEIEKNLPSIHKYAESRKISHGCIKCGAPKSELNQLDQAYDFYDSGLCPSCDHEQYKIEQEAIQDERQRRNEEIELEIQKESFYTRYGTPWKF